MINIIQSNSVIKNIRQNFEKLKEQDLTHKTETIGTSVSHPSNILNIDKELSIEQIIFYLELQNFKILQVLGKGQIGKVFRVIDKDSQIHYACKIISSESEYFSEKKIMLQLNDKLKETQYRDNVVNLIDFNDQEKILFYTSGDCSLKDYSQQMMEDKYFWFDNIKQFNFLVVKIYKVIQALTERNIFHSDIKPSNIILSKDFDVLSYGLEPKFIDFSSSAFDDFNHLTGYTPQYGKRPDFGFKNREERIIWEFQQLGRTIQKLMMDSVETKLNQQIKEFNFIHNYTYKNQFENEKFEIIQDIQLLSQFYPAYLIQLLDLLLVQEEVKLEGCNKIIDFIEENSIEEFTDDNNLVKNITEQKLQIGVNILKTEKEFEQEIEDYLQLELFQKALILLTDFFKKYDIKENANMVYIALYIYKILDVQEERLTFINEKITEEIFDHWKKSNSQYYYLIKLLCLDNFSDFTNIYDQHKEILSEMYTFYFPQNEEEEDEEEENEEEQEQNKKQTTIEYPQNYIKALFITCLNSLQWGESRWNNIGGKTDFLKDYEEQLQQICEQLEKSLQEQEELKIQESQNGYRKANSDQITLKEFSFLKLISLGNQHALQSELIQKELTKLDEKMVDQNLQKSFFYAYLQDRIANQQIGKYHVKLCEKKVDSQDKNQTSSIQKIFELQGVQEEEEGEENKINIENIEKLEQKFQQNLKIALDVFNQTLGEKTKVYISVLYTYLESLILLKSWNKANKIIQKLINIQEKTPNLFQKQHLQMNNMYYMQIQQELYKEKQRRIQESLQRQFQSQNSQHLQIINSTNLIKEHSQEDKSSIQYSQTEQDRIIAEALINPGIEISNDLQISHPSNYFPKLNQQDTLQFNNSSSLNESGKSSSRFVLDSMHQMKQTKFLNSQALLYGSNANLVSSQNLRSFRWNDSLKENFRNSSDSESDLSIDSEDEKEFLHLKEDLNNQFQKQARKYIAKDQAQKGLFFQKLACKYKKTQGNALMAQFIELKVDILNEKTEDNRNKCEQGFKKVNKALQQLKKSKTFMEKVKKQEQKQSNSNLDSINTSRGAVHALNNLKFDKFFFLKELYKNFITNEEYEKLIDYYKSQVEKQSDFKENQLFILALYYCFALFKIQDYHHCFQVLFNLVQKIHNKLYSNENNNYVEMSSDYFLVRLICLRLSDMYSDYVNLNLEDIQNIDQLQFNYLQLKVLDLMHLDNKEFYYQRYVAIKLKILSLQFILKPVTTVNLNEYIRSIQSLTKICKQYDFGPLLILLANQKEIFLDKKLKILFENLQKFQLKNKSKSCLFNYEEWNTQEAEFYMKIARIYEDKHDVQNAKYYYQLAQNKTVLFVKNNQSYASIRALKRLHVNKIIEQIENQPARVNLSTLY